MANVFTPRANLLAWTAIMLGLILLVGGAAAFWYNPQSTYKTNVGYAIEQPVPFSHKHHVGDLGIDCRYCHRAVETSNTAGLPATDTCMNCHDQLWTGAKMLQPVRTSWKTGKPLRWNRVNQLPDYVFFNHSIHIAKGVSCVQCHGRVDKMALTEAKKGLFMKWCLNCHRDPAPRLRPKEQVFNMQWQPPQGVSRRKLGQKLMKQYHINTMGLTNCTTCHR